MADFESLWFGKNQKLLLCIYSLLSPPFYLRGSIDFVVPSRIDTESNLKVVVLIDNIVG